VATTVEIYPLSTITASGAGGETDVVIGPFIAVLTIANVETTSCTGFAVWLETSPDAGITWTALAHEGTLGPDDPADPSLHDRSNPGRNLASGADTTNLPVAGTYSAAYLYYGSRLRLRWILATADDNVDIGLRLVAQS